MNIFQKLPNLCLDLVALHIIDQSTDPLISIATLAMTSKSESIRCIVNSMHEIVDPGCVKEAQVDRQNQKESIMIAHLEIQNRDEIFAGISSLVPVSISHESKGSILKAYCKSLGTCSSGTKDAMFQSIKSVIEERKQEATKRDIVLRRVVNVFPISEWRCPIRSRVRLLMKAKRSPDSIIFATDARTDHNLSKSILDGLEHVEGSLRLFRLVHVIEAAILHHGKSHIAKFDLIEKCTRQYEMEIEEKREQEYRNREIKRRRDLLDNVLREHGMRDVDLKRALGYARYGTDEIEENLYQPTGLQLITMFLEGKDVGSVEKTVMGSVEIHKRYAELTTALREVGCEVRVDSGECHDYISYGHGNLKNIVIFMHEMRWLFENTFYKQIFKKTLDSKIMENGPSIGAHEYACLRIDSTEAAKSESIYHWLYRQPSLDTALANENLPQTLRAMIVRDIAHRSASNNYIRQIEKSENLILPINFQRRIVSDYADSFCLRQSCNYDAIPKDDLSMRVAELTKQYIMISKLVDSRQILKQMFMSNFITEAQFMRANENDVKKTLERRKLGFLDTLGGCPECKNSTRVFSKQGLSEHIKVVHRNKKELIRLNHMF